jgi:hypothetical protein
VPKQAAIVFTDSIKYSRLERAFDWLTKSVPKQAAIVFTDSIKYSRFERAFDWLTKSVPKQAALTLVAHSDKAGQTINCVFFTPFIFCSST